MASADLLLYGAYPIASYLVGAIPFGYLVGKLARGVDIRTLGSGNIGATNAGRVLGRPYGVLVFLLDGAKGFGPVAAAALLFAEPRPVWPPLLAGLAAFLGHLFPIYLGFVGGKGVSTAAGVFLALAPLATLAAFGVFGAALAAFRFVSLASMSASLALPAVYAVLERDRLAARWPVLLFCSLTAALVVLRHRANVKRLIAGTEPRIGEGKK